MGVPELQRSRKLQKIVSEREVEREQHQKRNREREQERCWGGEELEAKEQQRDGERDIRGCGERKENQQQRESYEQRGRSGEKAQDIH